MTPDHRSCRRLHPRQRPRRRRVRARCSSSPGMKHDPHARRGAARRDDRVHLREAVDANARLVRGGRRGAGRDAARALREELQLGRGETLADTATALSGYAAAIVVRTFARPRSRSSPRGDRAGHQRAHGRAPPVPGAGRPAHAPRALRRARGAEGRLRRATATTSRTRSPRRRAWRASSSSSPPRRGTRRTSPATVVADPAEAVGRDAVYTDVWASMGEEAERDARLEASRPYQVDEELMALAARTRSSSTACPPTAARRSPPR